MPQSGQPAINPFAVQPVTARPGQELNIVEPVRFFERRGISRMAVRDRLSEMSLRRATAFSVGAHVVGPFLLAGFALLAIFLLSLLLNFNFWDLFKPKASEDIEFALVKDTKAPMPTNPRFKGNFNQQAGGKQDHTKPLKAVEDPPAAPARRVDPQPKQAAQTPAPVQPESEKPQEAPSRPAFVPSIPIPEPPTPPVTETTGMTGASVAPPQVASIGDSFAGTDAGSNATMANPQDGPGQQSGVDVAMDVDFGPFMAALEKRIKQNWIPSRGSESRKVVLRFYLARDGKLVKIETMKTSGDEETDRAAKAAVEASSPFLAFPPQVKEEILPIEFTFDYNVLNPKNTKRGSK